MVMPQTWNIVLNNNDIYKSGLENLLLFCKFYKPLNCELEICKHPENDTSLFRVIGKNGKIKLSCKEKSAFFHALLCIAEQKNIDENFEITRYTRFETMSALVDVSRNAVYTINELKAFICRLALLGYNCCYLYMEDLYRLPDYPMFGYLRGSFTKEELKELDAFAQTLGIELVPSIQALAHLKTALRWKCMDSVRDTAENLLVGEDATYKLIDDILNELSSIFTSRRIHLGMDEAMMIGTGISSHKFGYIPPAALMKEHLTRVSELVKKHKMMPMVWDDMLFRSADVEGSYYGLRIDEALSSNIHSDMHYIYWDYYHESEKHYASQLKARKNLNVIFAGGIWKWTGFIPGYQKTWNTSMQAIKACEKHGVKEIIATLWADDGGETPFATVLPGVILYGEYRFNTPGNSTIDTRCNILSGISLNDYFSIEEFDFLPGYPKHNYEGTNPSKQILYSDIFCGLYDWHYGSEDIAEHFKKCAKKMQEIAKNTDDENPMTEIFKMYAKMADILYLKAPLGNNLRKAYKENNREKLFEFVLKIDELSVKAKSFHKSVVSIWNKSCKGQGLEVLDLRLGGLTGRFETASHRLKGYLAGEIETLDELEQEILPFDGNKDKRPPIAYHTEIITANTVSHSR